MGLRFFSASFGLHRLSCKQIIFRGSTCVIWWVHGLLEPLDKRLIIEQVVIDQSCCNYWFRLEHRCCY